MPYSTWNGTPDEGQELVRAISNNCMCEFGIMGVRTATCEPHAAMVSDQRWLDGLIFMRRMADQLRKQENMEAEDG